MKYLIAILIIFSITKSYAFEEPEDYLAGTRNVIQEYAYANKLLKESDFKFPEKKISTELAEKSCLAGNKYGCRLTVSRISNEIKNESYYQLHKIHSPIIEKQKKFLKQSCKLDNYEDCYRFGLFLDFEEYTKRIGQGQLIADQKADLMSSESQKYYQIACNNFQFKACQILTKSTLLKLPSGSELSDVYSLCSKGNENICRFLVGSLSEVKADDPVMIRWLESKCKSNDKFACSAGSRLLFRSKTKNYQKVNFFLEKTCEADPVSCYILAFYYSTSDSGLTASFNDYVKFLTASCEKQNPYACFDLATVYKFGLNFNSKLEVFQSSELRNLNLAKHYQRIGCDQAKKLLLVSDCVVE